MLPLNKLTPKQSMYRVSPQKPIVFHYADVNSTFWYLLGI